MKKIYIVTAWSYSDYHICSVFLSKKHAENYTKIFNNADCDIEEHIVGECNGNLKAYFVRVTKDFTIDEWYHSESTHWFSPADDYKIGIDCDWNMYNHILAKNEEEARRIAIDEAKANRPVR